MLTILILDSVKTFLNLSLPNTVITVFALVVISLLLQVKTNKIVYDS
jgi:FtsH-binding integral membrane protein